MQDLSLFYAPNAEDVALLPEEEAAHATRVLRLASGDLLYVTNGKGKMWLASLGEVNKKGCSFELLKEESYTPYWRGEINLCIAPTKSMDRMEWLLEKAVEIGVNRIILLKSKHGERKHINVKRLEKILISAMKQSRKAQLPDLILDESLEDVLTSYPESDVLMFHCRDEQALASRSPFYENYTKVRDVTLLIGPEGDFSMDEIKLAESKGAKPTTLGESRLRTETAAIVALQWVHSLQMIIESKK